MFAIDPQIIKENNYFRDCHPDNEAAEIITNFLSSLSSEELEALGKDVKETQNKAQLSEEEADLISSLTQNQQYSEKERQKLEWETFVRQFQWRRNLLKDTITTPKVAKLLGTSRQTPHDRVKSCTLLAVTEKGHLRFPIWQFDPEGPDGVIEGFPEVIKALQVSALAKINWLSQPNNILDGLTPIEALKQGQKKRVLIEARGVGIL
ncbi:hypothetical protein [Crocosphaera sp. XPORK-15E]|uniref:hypothetical protein n=1 Tax=Crocosphaera sp. XPORK-15E TaxID=3110247 RepID=UPI002B21D0BD|nr:hypothetical protein [Crocosphaera sp. XPORK-15E]MEA5532778.1 hypothetical protein [Crocosphaera sp. XPORK-15E]